MIDHSGGVKRGYEVLVGRYRILIMHESMVCRAHLSRVGRVCGELAVVGLTLLVIVQVGQVVSGLRGGGLVGRVVGLVCPALRHAPTAVGRVDVVGSGGAEKKTDGATVAVCGAGVPVVVAVERPLELLGARGQNARAG